MMPHCQCLSATNQVQDRMIRSGPWEKTPSKAVRRVKLPLLAVCEIGLDGVSARRDAGLLSECWFLGSWRGRVCGWLGGQRSSGAGNTEYVSM